MTENTPSELASAPTAITRAIEAFVKGFGFTRSFTHPYLAERVGPLWVLRDAPRKHGKYRTEEWVAYNVAPAEIDRIARQHTRGHFAVCAICDLATPHEPLRSAFKSLGYRLGTSEPLMIHSLSELPHFESPVVIQRVTTVELAQQLARANHTRPLLPEYFLSTSRLRQYVALVDDKVVGWVRSIVVGQATWCSDMYVEPAFRRRGIARAMLCRLLQDDAAGGAQEAVLLASHTGAKLYAAVGYQQLGTLLLFTPKVSL